jgi:hypothetical protein
LRVSYCSWKYQNWDGDTIAFGVFGLMPVDIDQHIEETTLERYSTGSLPEEAAAEVEQHLLLCRACCAKVTEPASYVRAMKRRLTNCPTPEPSRWNKRLLFSCIRRLRF